MSNIRICGHRGVAAQAPENTLAGIELARDQKVGQVEVDLRLTKDSRVVLHHDPGLGRTSDGEGLIGEWNFPELERVDVGSWFSAEFSGQRIPLLGDALATGGDGMLWNLELKTDEPGNAATGKQLLEAVIENVAALDMVERVLLTSFDQALIEAVGGMPGAPRCGCIYGKASPRGEDLQRPVAVFSIRHDLISRDLVARVHDTGREVHAWTVNDPGTLERMMDLAVDVVISDDPVSLRLLL